MKIQDFISGGYYINLDYRQDKNKHMQDELLKHGLGNYIHRFSAISAFDKIEYIKEDHDKMIAASSATALSHRSVIEKAKQLGWENILILEDDAQFYECAEYKGIEVVEKALDQLSVIDNWEIYFLGANLYDTTLTLSSPNLIKCNCCVSTQAYILNSNTFDTILNQDKITHMDVFLNNTFNQKYISYPLAVIQKPNEISDLGGHLSVSVEFWENHYNKPIVNL